MAEPRSDEADGEARRWVSHRGGASIPPVEHLRTRAARARGSDHG